MITSLVPGLTSFGHTNVTLVTIMLKLFHSNKEEMLHHSNLFQMLLKLHSLKVFNPNFFSWMFEIVVEFPKKIYKMGSEQWHSSSQWRFFTRRQLVIIISAINIIILLQPIIHKPSFTKIFLHCGLFLMPYQEFGCLQ